MRSASASNAMRPLLGLLLLQAGTAWALGIGQLDDFQDGGLQGWQMGSATVTNDHMTNMADGGPAGAGDHYLQVTTDSTLPFGGNRLTVFNKAQWSGDYLTAGITAIAMDVRNFTPGETLDLRLGINGFDSFVTVGGLFATSDSVSLTSDSGWAHAVFSLLPGDLVPVSGRSGVTGNDVLATLGNVTELRLLNSAAPSWTGDPVTATLGVDNIRVVPLPPALWLFLSALPGLWALQRRPRRNGGRG